MKTPSVGCRAAGVVQLVGFRVAEGRGVEEADLQDRRRLVRGQVKGRRSTLEPEPLGEFMQRLQRNVLEKSSHMEVLKKFATRGNEIVAV